MLHVARTARVAIRGVLSRCRSLSTVSLGTAYEEHVLIRLTQLLPGRVRLRRVGGAGDRGVDLRGWWHLPNEEASVDSAKSQRLRLIVQCKASAAVTAQKKLGPQVLREVEGVLARHQRYDFDEIYGEESEGEARSTTNAVKTESSSPDTPVTPLVALICSSSGFSKQTNMQTNALSGPHVMLMHLPLPSDIHEAHEKSITPAPTPLLVRPAGTQDLLKSRSQEAHGTPPLSVLLTPSLTSVKGPLMGHLGVQWSRSPDQESQGSAVITWKGIPWIARD